MEGECGAFLARYDPFFLLRGLVTHIFCPKECLTTLRVVKNMTYSCLSWERSPGCLFKGVTRARGAVPKRYIPSRMGMYIWARLVEENVIDWAIILRSLVGRALLAGVVGPSPWYPTMPPFFLAREGGYPRQEKESMFD